MQHYFFHNFGRNRQLSFLLQRIGVLVFFCSFPNLCPAFEEPNDRLSEKQYTSRLKAADKQTFKNEFESEILLLLDREFMEAYSKFTSLADRKSFIDYFWKAQNPNPLTPENDRLLTHLQRRDYARTNFPQTSPPYFDKRGEYFIKYGKPRFRYRDLGGPRAIKSLVSIPQNYYSVKPNESWSYVNVAPNFVVHFAKEGDSYDEIDSLEDLITGNQRKGILIWYWIDLLKNRFWMSSLINETVTEIINIENQLLIANRGAPVVVDSRVTRVIQNDVFSFLKNTDYETQRASLDIPPMTYRPHVKNKYPMTYDVMQFRGPNGQTRLEIFLLSPLKKYIDRSIPISADLVDAEFSCLLRDELFNSVASSGQQRKFLTKFAEAEKLPSLVGNLTLFVAPQSLDLSLQVKNNHNDDLGFLNDSLDIRNFDDTNLIISDVQFYVEVTNVNQKQALPVMEKQNISVAPYPFEKVRKSLPLYCYFELYNLQSIGVNMEYEITYKISGDKSNVSIFEKFSKWVTGAKDPSISISHPQAINADTSQELIAIDLSKLGKGAYQLEVIVSDTKDSTVTARAQKEFILVD